MATLIPGKHVIAGSNSHITTIDAQRFLDDLEMLGRIGLLADEEGGGLDRRPFSDAERAARDFFQQRGAEAGLDVTVDGAANISARLACGPANARTVLIGSHLDTVPNGGRYDGALGVVAALEMLRTVSEHDLQLPFHLEALAFTDGDGRFRATTGSQALAGGYGRADLSRFLDRAAGYPNDVAAMQSRVPGELTVDGMLSARRDMDDVAAFFELHIEQGPRLEHADAVIGVASAIVGRRSYQVAFSGRSDHSGTTPMDLRADALVAAARFITKIDETTRRTFPTAVLTCGGIDAGAGVYNVVPNRAHLLLEFRAADEATIAVLDSMVRRTAAEIANESGVAHELTATGNMAPQSLDGKIQLAIRYACERLGLRHLTFPSGAVHDAHALAPHVPTGLIFVPSIGGRSHCPEEATAPEDLVAGANVLLQSILVLAEQMQTR